MELYLHYRVCVLLLLLLLFGMLLSLQGTTLAVSSR
jgi:hypothetical protein